MTISAQRTLKTTQLAEILKAETRVKDEDLFKRNSHNGSTDGDEIDAKAAPTNGGGAEAAAEKAKAAVAVALAAEARCRKRALQTAKEPCDEKRDLLLWTEKEPCTWQRSPAHGKGALHMAKEPCALQKNPSKRTLAKEPS